MDNQPKVSVLIPVGRNKRFLKAALDSIKMQTYGNVEILIEEDRKHEGISKLLNRMAAVAKGEYLARMDADDISEPDRIEKQVKYLLSNPGVVLVGSWATLIDESGDEIGLKNIPTSWKEIKKQVFYRNPFIHPSWMVRRDWFLASGGYDESYKVAQDWEFISRWVWTNRMENIPESLVKLRLHPKSVSFQRNRLQVAANFSIRWQMIRDKQIKWWKAVVLLETFVAWFIPAGIKFKLQKILLITDTRSGARYQQQPKALGIVLPMGQNKKLIRQSGQWNLWEYELEYYRKEFENIEFFEYRYHDWRRYVESVFMPIFYFSKFRRCRTLKAVHLTAAIPCLVSKMLYGTRYILSYGYRYDEFAAVEKKWVAWLLSKILTPIAVKFAEAVIVPTEELRSYVQKHGAKAVGVIPNGVNTKLFKGPTPTSRRGRTLSDIFILFVGRLEKQKNLDTLIKAVSQLNMLNLVFIGDGTQKQYLHDLAKKIKVKLIIRTPVENRLLPEIYRRADIFVLPSLVEGHPKVLLEAMSCGLPCIASDIPGPREIIQDNVNGILVAPTIAGFSDGVVRLMQDKVLRRKLGEGARQTVLCKFDKKKLMKSEINIFKQI